jgi:hypothetical protein
VGIGNPGGVLRLSEKTGKEEDACRLTFTQFTTTHLVRSWNPKKIEES